MYVKGTSYCKIVQVSMAKLSNCNCVLKHEISQISWLFYSLAKYAGTN